MNNENILHKEIDLIQAIITRMAGNSFFLHRERCYRELYKWVITHRAETTDYAYSLDYDRFKHQVPSLFCIMFSKTLWPFYGLFFVILLVITVYNLC